MPTFMNEYEIRQARTTYVRHPILGPATRTLENLMDAVNRSSDGWPYWSAPVRAAGKLQDLIQGPDGTPPWETDRPDVTPAQYRKALGPIKAFRTRCRKDVRLNVRLDNHNPLFHFRIEEI